jgi:Cu(I)/Ag(I) efflux system membrane fusion protein
MGKPNVKNRSTWSVLRPHMKLLVAIIVGICIGFALHWGLKPAQTMGKQIPSSSSSSPKEPVKEIDHWTCSMHPQIIRYEPGLCPICKMELIPVYKETQSEMSGMRQFTTSEAAKALMDIETAPVERKFVTAEIRMVGKVQYDETKLAYITAWVPGRLDQLYVDYTGVPVKKGDHMVYMYSPELVSAQGELIQAIKAVKNIEDSKSDIIREVTAGTVDAAREKLRLLGLSSEQIAEIEKRGTATDHITIYAPISGIVVHKDALEGMYVNTGTRIYTVADLSHVWVKLDAYESDLSWLRFGQEVEFSTVSFPGDTFKGTISFIDPVLDPVTRTVKIRVDVPNPDGRLKPEMFVKAIVKANVATGKKVMDPRLAGKWICPMHPSVVKDEPGECDICGMPLVRTESLGYVSAEPTDADKPLVIPASAALVTGTRAIVYVEVPNTEKPTYEGREIVLGPRAGNYYIVRSGLEEGQRVITKGNFKIDSALQIQAKPSMMTPEGGGGSSGHMNMNMGSGKMDKPSVSAEGQTLLSETSRRQLNEVIAASDVVIDAVQQLDLSQVKLAFAELEKAIKQVDMELLEGHLHMLWMEMSMRLNNDAVEGRQAQTLEDAQKVAESLKTNIASLKSKFGLMSMNHKTPGEPVSAEFSSQLEKVFEAYFDIQQALASDKFVDGMTGVNQMNNALAGVEMKLLTDENHQLWMKQANSLEQIISNAAKAENIEQLRPKFALLSEQMFAVAKQFGAPGKSAIYQIKCPMAFNNRGATWLQQDKDIHNPYFGSAMPQCGSVIEVIEPVNDANNGDLQHG